MKIYEVGGAVRDELLGLPVKDRDYVVVGADPDEMAKQGFRPVGADFPVFHQIVRGAQSEKNAGVLISRGGPNPIIFAAIESRSIDAVPFFFLDDAGRVGRVGAHQTPR